MSAVDTFVSFNTSLSNEVRIAVADVIAASREELQAARSEDARVRIVEGHIREINLRMKRLTAASSSSR